jgi:isopenicillin N synthase-like dioxygenase
MSSLKSKNSYQTSRASLGLGRASSQPGFQTVQDGKLDENDWARLTELDKKQFELDRKMKADMKRLNQQRMKEELDGQRNEKVYTKKQEHEIDNHYYNIAKDILGQ